MIDEELERDIQQAIDEVIEGKRLQEVGADEVQRYDAGRVPLRMHKGIGAAWNFTIGPAFVYTGPHAIDTINFLPEPVVLFASYIPEDELKKLEVTRVRGFVVEEGSIIDPTYWWYVDENRASIVTCEGVMQHVRHREPVIVDGVRGRVYLTPDKHTMENYERLRMLGPPHRDQLYWNALRQLSVTLMGSRKARKIDPPYAFPEQDRLLDLARRARSAEPISEEDNQWMQDILMEGMPRPDEIQAEFTARNKEDKGRGGKAPELGGADEGSDEELSGAALRRKQRQQEAEEKRRRREE